MSLYMLSKLIRYKTMPSDYLDSNIRVQYNQIAYIFGDNVRERDRVIKELTEKKEITMLLNKNKMFDLMDYKSGRYIADCLYYHGLITYSEIPNVYKIPNLVSYEMLLSYFEKIENFEISDHKLNLLPINLMRDGDISKFVAGFFEEVIQKFPGDFFKDVNESFYRGLFFHILYNAFPKNRYEIFPEFNLPNGCVDIIMYSLSNAKTQAEFKYLVELKRVPKYADDKELEIKFAEAKKQVLAYRTGEYADYTAVAICFRGNKDYKMEIFESEEK